MLSALPNVVAVDLRRLYPALEKGAASPDGNVGAWRSFPLALPPLPEQEYIVALLDKLLAEVSTL